MIVSAMLKAGLDCPECKLAVPINAIAPAMRCTHCSSNVSLNWSKLLDLGNPKVNALDRAIALDVGKSDTSAFASIHLEVTRADPTCRACQAVLSGDTLVARARDGGESRCLGCGAAIPLRASPPELVAAYPAARALVYEDVASGESAVRPEQSQGALVFACMSCGAGLKLDGAERTVECQYCRASNYLPDGVWLRLHPPQKSKPFFVLCDVDEPAIHALHYRFDDGGGARARRDAKRADLPLAQLLALARSTDSSVQLEVAAHPGCTPEVLLALATSESRAVRDAVAANPRVSAPVIAAMGAAMEARVLGADREDDDRSEIRDIAGDPRATLATIAALARSQDEDVRAAVAANPSTPVETASALHEDPEDDVRVAVAMRAGLPATVYEALARDTVADVRKAIAARTDVPSAVLSSLGGDTEVDVLRALAANPSTPAEALAKIAASGDEEARRLARKQPHYPRKWWDVF
ncbi:MAG: hypothetical protein ACLQVI_25050 [Polyangiaceae bacterium]